MTYKQTMSALIDHPFRAMILHLLFKYSVCESDEAVHAALNSHIIIPPSITLSQQIDFPSEGHISSLLVT